MDTCYICSREAKTRCTVCYKDICNAHAEDEQVTDNKISAICTTCKKKKRLKRIRLYTVLFFVVMAVAIVLGLVFTSLNIWS